MKKKVIRKSRRRLLLFGTISVGLIIYFIFSLSYYILNIAQLKSEEKKLTTDLQELKHDEKLLKTEIEKLNDKDYLARYARENYAYSKDGELVIKIEKEKEITDEQGLLDFNIDVDKFIIAGVIIFLLIIIHVLKKGKRKKSY